MIRYDNGMYIYVIKCFKELVFCYWFSSNSLCFVVVVLVFCFLVFCGVFLFFVLFLSLECGDVLLIE